jgi:outer membrane immunogenic protein
MLRTTAIALALTATAGAALAAGPEPVVVEEVVVVDVVAPFWAGGYVGGQIGWGYSDFDIGDLVDDLGDTFSDIGNDDSGVVGGITLGYLWSLNNGWYLGPEFQYDWVDLEVKNDATGATTNFEEIARLKLIAGYEMGNGLLYGSAGIAYGSLDNAGDIFDGFDGSDTNWTAGLGYDYRVGDNWTIGGEYQYADFEDVSLNTISLKATYRF